MTPSQATRVTQRPMQCSVSDPDPNQEQFEPWLSILVALGVDYNIFLMSRVHEESAHLGTRPGMLKGLAVTGGVITSAGLVLAATFGVLSVLPLVSMTELGFIVAFGVLLDTLIVRSVLVPALTLDFGRRCGGRAASPARIARQRVLTRSRLGRVQP